MPPNLDLTPWALALAIATAIFGPTVAALVGAYGIIMLGWFAGLLYGLYTRDPDSKMPVWAYSAFTFIVCVIATVPLSLIAAAHIPWFEVDYTSILGVVAAAIPALPDKWSQLGRWALATIRARGIRQ
jgi:hypothetical protein